MDKEIPTDPDFRTQYIGQLLTYRKIKRTHLILSEALLTNTHVILTTSFGLIDQLKTLENQLDLLAEILEPLSPPEVLFITYPSAPTFSEIEKVLDDSYNKDISRRLQKLNLSYQNS
jgi:hypothetical protein